MVSFDKFKLENGLTVIVHQDKNTPMVAMNIIYKVGARDEDPEKTGFAHLFEHLMFGGSINIPRYDEPLQKAGGENNAFTNSDFTDYYLTIPSNNIETAFWLESDRMLSLAFTEKSLEVQRQVVIEEFKQNYLNQPYGDVYLLLKPLAYHAHPYRWNTIGKEISHIEHASMDDVKSFYRKYYNPDNAIMTIAGDVTTGQVRELAEKWFGDIPSGKPFTRDYPEEPEQVKAREEVVERYVPQNAIYIAWHMPRRKDLGFYPVDLISDILSNGNSSRLHQELVKGKKLFSEISAFVTGDLDRGLFIVNGKLKNGLDKEEAVGAIWEQLSKLKQEPVSTEEMEKVQNKVEANLIFSRMSVLNKAMHLGYYELLGDAALWNKEAMTYGQFTKEDLMDAADSLFREEKSNTLFYNARRS
jgi:predicted Zn-dependent peptidase